MFRCFDRLNESQQKEVGSYLHHLQIGQPLLHQLLYLALLGLMLVLSERIDGASSGVLPEVVGGELVCLTEERPELYSLRLLVSNMHLSHIVA